MTNISSATAIDYPESDGKPLGESDVHRLEIIFICGVLMGYFIDEPGTYVSGNLMFYYEEGNPAAVVSPDVFVIKGVGNHMRRTYKLWEEGQVPCFALEVSSRSTRREDLRSKKALYARLGIAEYLLFDPLAEYLRPPLQGFQLIDGEYQRMQAEADGSLRSVQLGLRLRHEGHSLQLYSLATGERLLRVLELTAAQRAAEAEARRAVAAAARQAAAARRAVEAEAERAVAAAAQQAVKARRAVEAAIAAEAEARQAAEAQHESEQRAAALAAEVSRLEAELARLKGEA